MKTPRFKLVAFVQKGFVFVLLCVFNFMCKMVISQVPVQMMYMGENVDVYYDQAINTSVLHLPFNSSYSMLLLLPDKMETLENAIYPGHVTKWLKWMESRLEKSKIIHNLI